MGSVSFWEVICASCRTVKDLYFLPCSLVDGTVGRGAIFPVESCVVQIKQKSQLSPECFTGMHLLCQYLKKKRKNKNKNLSFPPNPFPISLVSMLSDRGPKYFL